MNRSTRIALACAAAASFASPAAMACNPDSYLATVCMTAATFCPQNTMEADGRLLAIAQNQALFALLGTTYGGNGVNTFALPDLRSRGPLGGGMGAGPGLSPVQQGESGGAERRVIGINQMPMHSHAAQLRGTGGPGNTDNPAGAVPARLARSNIYGTAAADTPMGVSAVSVGSAGGSQPLDTRNPYLGLRFCVVASGIFPSRP